MPTLKTEFTMSPPVLLSRAKQMRKLKEIVRPEILEQFEVGKSEIRGKGRVEQERLLAIITKASNKRSATVIAAKKVLKEIEAKYATSKTVYLKLPNGERMPLMTLKASSEAMAKKLGAYWSLVFAASGIKYDFKRSSTSERIAYYRTVFGNSKEQLQKAADDNGISANQAWLNWLGNAVEFTKSPAETKRFQSATAPMNYDIESTLSSMEALAKNSPGIFRDLVLYDLRGSW